MSTTFSATTFASGVLLNGPYSLAFDKNGNLFCANNIGSTILKITPHLGVSIFASSGINRPSGLAVDKNGNLFCTNYANDNIVKITPSGSLSTVASINRPQSLAFDINGYLYTGTGDNKLNRISISGVVQELTITGPVLDDPEGLAFDHKGNLFAVSKDDNNIIKIALGVPSEILVKERFLKKGKVNTISSKNEVLATIQTLNPEDKNSTTLQSLILRYQNNREALLEIEKAFGISIVG